MEDFKQSEMAEVLEEKEKKGRGEKRTPHPHFRYAAQGH